VIGQCPWGGSRVWRVLPWTGNRLRRTHSCGQCRRRWSHLV